MKKILVILIFLIRLPIWAAEFPEISIVDLQLAIREGKVAIIDVNGAKSFGKGHIPGAINFSTDSGNLKNLLPKDKNTLVVAYCGGPGCRAYLRGTEAASQLGFKNIKHLSAGISGWKKAGGKIETK